MVDAHPRAAVLEVRRDQQRDPGGALQAVQQRGVGVGRADRDDHAPDALLRNPLLQGVEAGIARRRVRARDPGDHELPDALAQGERSERLIHPCTRPAIEFIVVESREGLLRRAVTRSRAIAGRRRDEQERRHQRPRPPDRQPGPPGGAEALRVRRGRLHVRPHLTRTGSWIPSPISKKGGRRVGVRPRMGISPKSARAAAIWLTSDALQASMYAWASGMSESR